MRRVLYLACVSLLLGSCASQSASDSAAPRPASPDAAVLAEVRTAPCPGGVEPAVWSQLCSELARVLAARQNLTRGAAAAPANEASRPQGFISFAPDSFGWYHSLQGDYDQNGEVNIGDLTPLGQHLGETSGGGVFSYQSALSVIDGDSNGEINLADITPIGVNFSLRSPEYRVYGSGNPADYPASNDASTTLEPISIVAFSSALQPDPGFRKQFLVEFTIDPTFNYWVRPADGESLGTPSAMVSGSPPPEVWSVTISPDPVPAGGTAVVTAFVKVNDPNLGAPSLAWQLEGGGSIDPFDSPANLTAPAAGADTTLTLRLAVADGKHDVLFFERPVQVWAGSSVQWHSQTVASAENSGPDTALVAGGTSPQITYRHMSDDGTLNEVLLARGADLAGSSWIFETPIPAFAFGLDATVFNSHPAAVIFGLSNARSLHYVLPFGYTPVDIPGTDIEFVFELSCSLIGGQPAAVYGNGTGGSPHLMFVKAFDYITDVWSAPVEISSGPQVGNFDSLAEISGRPAVVYYDSSVTPAQLWFAIATDGSGTTWEQAVAHVDPDGKSLGRYCKLLEVAGRPAIVYNNVFEGVEYLRADDALGASWPAVATQLDALYGEGLDFALIGGFPAIVHEARATDGQTSEVHYVQAVDANGDSWNTPEIVDGFSNTLRAGGNIHCSLAEVDGAPAVSYYDSLNRDLKYAAKY